MGNSVSSDVSESLIRRSLDADRSVLSAYLSSSSSLTDARVLDEVYRELASGAGEQGASAATTNMSWLPPLQHDRHWSKQHRLRRKAAETRALLQLLPQHTQARQRMLKCLQRQSHFLVHNVDPHAHTMHQRSALLHRYLLAFDRMSQREAAAASGPSSEIDASGMPIPPSQRVEKRPVESAQDKQSFIELLFARSLDEFEDDPTSGVRHTTFVTRDEFVGQLLSILADNLPSQLTLDEEIDRVKQSLASPTVVDSPASPTPVSVFGLTGLMGMQLQPPEEEMRPEAGEDDATFAARINTHSQTRRADQEKKEKELAALQKEQAERRERQQGATTSQGSGSSPTSTPTPVDAAAPSPPPASGPDATLKPESHFASLQMLDLLIDESVQLTTQMIEAAAKEYSAFKQRGQAGDNAGADAADATTPSVYPLSPAPATHLLFFLCRDLMRKSLLCTHPRQRTIRQLHFVLKRIFSASAAILDAAEQHLRPASQEAEWADFEQQVQYETSGVDSLQSLFASCAKTTTQPQSSSSSSSATPAGSNAAGLSPLSLHSSPRAPLLATILSNSLLAHLALPSLAFVWTTLFKPIVFDDINTTQTVPERSAASDSPDPAAAGGATSPSSSHAPFNLLDQLVAFLRRLDTFNTSLPSTAAEERLFRSVSDAPMSRSVSNHLSVVVETPHTYFSDSEDQQVVYIPNASYLVVEFDSRCSSEKGRDHLTITVPTASEESGDADSSLGFGLPTPPLKVAGPFHGNAANWPKMPIVIQNTNTLVFTFHSDAANNASTYFGYRAIVTGYSHLHELVPPASDASAASAESMQTVSKTVYSSISAPSGPRGVRQPKQTLSESRPWYFLFDLQQSVAHVIGRALRKEIIGTSASSSSSSSSRAPAAASAPASVLESSSAAGSALSEESVLAKYLNSPLFFNSDIEEGVEEPDSIVDEEQRDGGSGVDPTQAKLARVRREEHAFETRFLQDLIDAKPGSTGLQLDTHFRKRLQSKRVDALGGPVTKRAVRAFIAVMIKHLGLTKLTAHYLAQQGIAVDGIEAENKAETTEKQTTNSDPTPSVFGLVNTPLPTPSITPSVSLSAILPHSADEWSAFGDQLLEVWRKGQSLHQVIVSGKQLAQQALDNLIAEEEALQKAKPTEATSGDATVASSSSTASPSSPLPAAPSASEARASQSARARAERMSTYEGFTAGMVEKCAYLLKQHSFAHHPLATFAEMSRNVRADTAAPVLDIATDAIETLARLRGAPSEGNNQQSMHSLRSLMHLYHTTHQCTQHREEAIALRQTTHHCFHSLTDLISTFLRDDVPLATIRRIRRQQVDRAVRRANAMETMTDLIKSISASSSHVALMSTFGPPFRAYTDYGLGSEDDNGSIIGGHYYAHIEASGRRYRQRVHDAFNRLYTHLLHQLQRVDGTVSLAFKSLVLDALCIDWHATVRENSWIVKHQLINILDAIIDPTRQDDVSTVPQEVVTTPFQQLAENLLQFISINCMSTQVKRATKNGPTASNTNAITTEEQKRTDDEKESKSADTTEQKSADNEDDASPPAPRNTFSDPFAFLSESTAVHSSPLDTLQRAVLDRLVASLHHAASLLSSLRKSGGESLIDSEILDLSLTPEQKHLLYRRKTRPSASAAVSSSSAQERQAQMAGILIGGDDDGAGLEDDEIDIDYGDAHPSFPLIRRYLHLEQRAYDTIALLSSIAADTHHRAYLEYLCSPPVMRSILLVFVSGSPRMQTIAVRLLTKVMPLVTAFQLRENSLLDYLVRADKDERLGPAKAPTHGSVTNTPTQSSATSTPFSHALKQSYQPQGALDTFSLGDAMPQMQTLALSRSSSLHARQATDAVLDADANEEKLDQLEGEKLIAFIFKKLADLLLATTNIDSADAMGRPSTPLANVSGGAAAAIAGHAAKSKHLNPLEFRDGQMKLVLASELVMLIRSLHHQTHVSVASASGRSSPQTIVNHDWSRAIHSFLTSHLLGLSQLVASDEPRIASSSLRSEVGLTLACLSVIGGHTEVARVGGLVRTSKQGESELGVIVSLDRLANRCKVLFRHAPMKVIEVELSKVTAVDSVPPDATLVTLNHALLHSFQIFTRALSEEEQERIRMEAELEQKKKEKAEKLELERLQKEFDAEEAKMMDPFGGFRDELAAFWACPACTFENPIVKPSCELCGQENPSYFIQQVVVEEEVDLEEELSRQILANRMTLTTDHLLYYQLRAQALKALCALLQNPHSLPLLFESKSSLSSQSMMPSLVAMAIRPTHLDVFKSIHTLEEVSSRLVELLSESSMGLVQDQVRFNRRLEGNKLKFSPFKQMQLHLPSNLDVGSARAVSFIGDRESLCEVRYNGTSSGLSVGLIRSNFLVPNSLPAYYFEVTIHALGSPAIPPVGGAGFGTPRSNSNSPSLTPQLVRRSSPVLRALGSPSRSPLPATPVLGGSAASGAGSSATASSSSAFDIAIGLFRCGMPLEGLPGRHSTYAYSGRNGELHLTRSKSVVREKIFPSFKSGDTIGCGVHLRYGQRTIFFTLNGRLLHAEEAARDQFDDLDLGPNAFGGGSGTTPRPSSAARRPATSSITSISGIEANLSGRFYPAIWFENPGAHVTCNFGQHQFRFDFATEVLPADYRQKLAAMEIAQDANGGKKLSAVEIKRRTMAEDLCEMMGNFPQSLCVLALERNNDDKAAAGDWLFSHGTKALEQMAADALRSQEEKKRQASRGPAPDDGESSGEDEDLAEYLAGGDASQAGVGRESRTRENLQNFLDDEVDADIPLGLDLVPRQQQQQQQAAARGAGRGHPELDRQRERARQLLQLRGRGNIGDDELEQLLAQVAGLGAVGGEEDLSIAAEPIVYENIKLDEIEPGQSLVVAPSAVRLTANQHEWMSAFAGRTGVVTGVNINAALVTLIFPDTAAGIKRCASFPVFVLQKPQRMWLDPCRDMYEKRAEAAQSRRDDDRDERDASVSWQDLAHEFVSIEKALSVQHVRRAVLRCIAHWPRTIEFDVQHLNGPDGVMAILKLTAAQFLSSNYKQQGANADSDGAAEGQINLLDSLKTKLIRLVHSEKERLVANAASSSRSASTLAPPLRITESLYNASVTVAKPAKSDVPRSSSSVRSASSVASSVVASHHGDSSASEYSEDDVASLGSNRRGGANWGASEPVDEGDDVDDDDEDAELSSDVAHDPDDGESYEDDDDPDGDYDEEAEDIGELFGGIEADQNRLMDLADFLRQDPQAARAHILQAAQRGGGDMFRLLGRGGGAGGGAAARSYLGRSSAAPPMLRSSRKKKKKEEEANAEADQLESLDEKLQQQLKKPRATGGASSSAVSDALLTPLLVEECLVHFIHSVHHGPPVRTVRSPHPYPSHTEKRGKVHIGGASKLLVRFDPRCQIGTDMMTRLSFYRDPNYQDLILTVQGSGPPPDHCFPPFIVDADRLYYKFTAGTNSRLWGFKFKVEPVERRIDDKAALRGRNFELSGWILDIILAHFPDMFQYAYATELYNALVWYVIHARPSNKSRGVDMLVRLLFHMRTLMQGERHTSEQGGKAAIVSQSQSPLPTTVKGSALTRLADLKKQSAGVSSSSPPPPRPSRDAASIYTLSHLPDFTKLHPLAQQMDSVLETMGLNNTPAFLSGFGARPAYHRSLQSPTMMGLVELLSTVDLLSNEFQHHYGDAKKDDTAATALAQKSLAADVSSLSLTASDPSIDLIDHFHDRLRIEKALLIFHSSPADKPSGSGSASSSSSSRPSKDITTDMAKYLGWQNNLQLFIPTDPRELATMPGFEGEVSVSSLSAPTPAAAGSATATATAAPKKAGYTKLVLTYSILTPTYNTATHQLESRSSKTITKSIPLQPHHKPTLIKPHASRFENVVQMSRLTLEMRNASQATAGPNSSSVSTPRLPSEFLLSSYRNFFVQKNFLSIVGDRVHDHTPGKPRITKASPSTGAHNGTRSYSVTFWIYSNTNAPPPPKEAHFRYILHAGNMPDQHSSNLAHGVVWPTSGFSIGLGSKDQMVHATFYEPSGTNPIRTHSRSPLQPKRWTCITMIVTDGIDLNLYIDGSIEITHRFPMTMPPLTTDPLFVGTLPAGMMKLYRQQTRSADSATPEDPYRVGLGFAGAVKDMRLYSYDIDASTFVAATQEKAKKYDKERSNKNNFHIAVEKPAVATRREIQEVLAAGANTDATRSESSVSSSLTWTPAMDIQVMELFQSIVASIRNKRPQDHPEDEDDDQPRPVRDSFVHLIDLPLASKAVNAAFREPKLLQSASLLTHIPHDAIKQRFATIQLLNAKLIDVLPFVDFTQSLNPWSLAHRLSAISWLILLEVKNQAWKSILTSTASGQSVNVTLNRPRALKARERGNDPEGLKSIFGQCFQQLHFLRPNQLRVPLGHRPFRVKFAGEGGIDAGGLYRDANSDVCTTLQSRDTPLFIPSPNAAGFGDFGNTWLPNPKSNSSLHKSMYAFVGKFMGMAIRGGHVLNLDFPPLVWKRIVSMPLTRDDIAAVNALAFKVLDQYSSPSLDRAQFEELPPQRFVTVTTDGREVELKENGAQMTVTFDTRDEYVRLEEQFRLHEFDRAIDAMKKGLGTIVPVHLLALFTPSEVETMVCGAREVDIEFLRRHTEYQRGIRPTDAHVRFFWTVLEEMSQPERQLFIRFVSGQSRLWSDDAAFTMKFKLMPSAVDNDNVLPVSHTCFFSLELPKYTTKTVLASKLLYAINNWYERAHITL